MRLDSIAYADSVARADSIAKAKKRQKPSVKPDNKPMTKYGIPYKEYKNQ
jgi:hypothetical protein